MHQRIIWTLIKSGILFSNYTIVLQKHMTTTNEGYMPYQRQYKLNL